MRSRKGLEVPIHSSFQAMVEQTKSTDSKGLLIMCVGHEYEVYQQFLRSSYFGLDYGAREKKS